MMTARGTCFTLCIVVALLFHCEVLAFTIHGTVTDNVGQPVHGAMVVVTNESDLSERYTGTTDVYGRYMISWDVGVKEFTNEHPEKFQLLQNWPNPFNPSTRLGYVLEKGCNVELVIFNILGQKVRVLDSGVKNAGIHVFSWNGCDDSGNPCSAGVYLYCLNAGDNVSVKKMVLLDGAVPGSNQGSQIWRGTQAAAKISSKTSATFYTIEVIVVWLRVYRAEHVELSHDMAYDIMVDPQEGVLLFADSNLELAVREKISKPEEDILTTDIPQLRSLDASDRGIINLGGIENLTSLTGIMLYCNYIGDISPLANLTSLIDVMLFSNNISDISSLANLTSIKHLKLDNNHITDISPLANLTMLITLRLDTNNITDISAPLSAYINETKICSVFKLVL